MSTHLALCLIHFLYVAFMNVAAWIQRRRRRQPKPLAARRSKVPKHLCLNLVAHDGISMEETESAFLQCLQSVAAWCRESGIDTLTVYDRHGVLYGCSQDAYRCVFLASRTPEDSCESEVEYPLTPPLSESSSSRSHSPEHGASLPADLNTITMNHLTRLRERRNVAVRRRLKNVSTSGRLTLYIASRDSGKPAIAEACRLLLLGSAGDASVSDDTPRSTLTMSKLAMVLEAGLPPPDLMIIHHIGRTKMPFPPIEFHGFPPWQNTLAEFHRTHLDDSHFDPSCSEWLDKPVLISETAFRRALDEYSGAEFRLGR